MSRIGKMPINVPEGVNVKIEGLNIEISGPKGSLSKLFSGDIDISLTENKVLVTPLTKSKSARSMWGTSRSIISSMIKGVKDGFVEKLEVNGVGYRASIKGEYINLALGKSHNTKIQIPNYIKAEIPKPTSIVLSSINKEKLGQFISIIKKQRAVEPYKGKGIITEGQFVQRKEGKKN